MKFHDLSQFAALMHSLGELYGKEITEVFSEIYWRTLKRFEWIEVKKAVSKHIADPNKGRFMPKPADIVYWIEGTQETRALRAWIKTIDVMRRYGVYESVIFDDPMIHTVIEALGGWVYLCMTKTENLPFVAQDFQKYYLAFLNDPPHQFHTHVVGMFRSSQPIPVTYDKKMLKKLESSMVDTKLRIDAPTNSIQESA